MPASVRPLAALALLLASVGAGCIGGAPTPGAEEDPELALSGDGEARPGNGTRPFEPPFELAAPRIAIAGADGEEPEFVEAGVEVTFSAVFDAASGVDATKVATYVWDFGDGTHSVGRDQRHAFATPGAHDVTVAVEDVYGRTASAYFPLGVAANVSETGTIAVGNGAQDAVPYSASTSAWDHRDHPLELVGPLTSVRITLTFDRKSGVSGFTVPAEANNLILKVLDAEGDELATATGAGSPKSIELDAADALYLSGLVVRVSGDAGLQVAYSVNALLVYSGGLH